MFSFYSDYGAPRASPFLHAEVPAFTETLSPAKELFGEQVDESSASKRNPPKEAW
jgi:hypothetical protein